MALRGLQWPSVPFRALFFGGGLAQLGLLLGVVEPSTTSHCPSNDLPLPYSMPLHALPGKQLLGVVVACGWSLAVTFGIMKLLAANDMARVSTVVEIAGLDADEHGETSYVLA